MSSPGQPDPLADFLAPLAEMGAATVAVMVSSVDGRATIGGRVGTLTGKPDQRVLLTVREHAAAVMIGAATGQAEGYDGLLGDEAKARRVKRGLPPEPELIQISKAGPPVEEIWAQVRARHPGSVLASEGGPTMLGVEIEHGLIDQLVLCVSPMIVGSDQEKRLVEHHAALGVELELLDSAHSDGFVFLRYQLLR